MRKRTATYWAVAAGAVAVTSNSAVADPPFFSLISDPSMGIHDISDISGDGTTVVGMSQTLGQLDHQPFRWTQARGFERLGYLPGSNLAIPYAVAEGVNADGSVVVGSCYMPNEDYLAFRWTPATGMVSLGELQGGYVASQAHGTNVDGTVIVGVSGSSNGIEAFRWVSGQGMQGLGALSSSSFRSHASAVSDDGSVVVGASYYNRSNSDEHAFQWTQATGMKDLGTLAGNTRSAATDISANGSTVVGWSGWGLDQRAVRWTQNGIQDLGLPPGGLSARAESVSGDGSVIVGTYSFGERGAFIWTEARGAVDLREHLLALGLSGVQDWNISATGVSDDGRIIAGIGENPVTFEVTGWIAHLGDLCYADCDTSTGVGILDVFDFLCFQNSFVNSEPYACDCDTSTGNGVCDVFDFLCFQDAFVGGCP